ncbi:MAG: DUF1802 family protein [Chthoniobacterales bacterium]
MESAGFKEWALVCAALGRGEQSILLRKGGIAEGRAGFSFLHREFFLFPTFFHEQTVKVRAAEAILPEPRSGEIELQFFARLDATAVITDWETASALEPWHILQSEVVRERFSYDSAPGIHVALVRVFRLEPIWTIPALPAYGGCRSWVKLPAQPPRLEFVPVLSEEEHERRKRLLRFRAAGGAVA